VISVGKQHLFTVLIVGLGCCLAYLVSQTALGKPPKVTEPTIQQTEQQTKQDKEEAKTVAIAFCESYVAYDYSNPEAYKEKIKPFAESRYHKELLKSRQAHPGEKTIKVVHSKAFPVDHDSANEQVWNVIIDQETSFQNDEKQRETTSFFVTLVKVDGWKVKEVVQDAYYSPE
jgi:hypothetical protein